MERINEATIENWFTSRAPNPEQVVKYARVNASCEALCRLILDVCPEDSADRTAALRQLRRLRNDINMTIAYEVPKL